MKQIIASALLLIVFLPSFSQLKTSAVCPPFVVDILDGRVNGLEIISTQGQIKKTLPCFSGEQVDDSANKCAGIFYKDRDLSFYTGRDYVEIGPKFKGKLTVPLMGASRNSLFKWLGIAKIKDINWDAFTTAYGIIILYYDNAGKVNRIQMSTKNTDTIRLCE